MYIYFNNAIDLAKNFIKKRVENNSIVIDATAGNGHDTLFLANLINENGKIYSFDIQEKAISNTKKRLIQNKKLDRVTLIKDSHENIDKYVKEKIDLVVFNLGYLPGGNHEIVTLPNSTITAIEKCLYLLSESGIILITAYIGHKGSKEEVSKVEKFLTNLNQKQFNVLKMDFINQNNHPPILYGIERKTN